MILRFFKRVISYLERKDFNKKLIAKNINLGSNVTFRGFPIIQINSDAFLKIGDNTLINSENYGYHVNMFTGCKLMADRKDAMIEIGKNTRLHGTAIHAYRKITIGDNCLIAANCQIIDCNGHDISFDNVDNRIQTFGTPKEVIIEDSVWLGTGVVVLPGVRIGKGSVISANSVVSKDIPPMSIAGGNPIQIFKSSNSRD